MFRDQYMEVFEIGRGKPKLKKKSTTQLEIEEAFRDSPEKEQQITDGESDDSDLDREDNNNNHNSNHDSKTIQNKEDH